MNLTFDQVVSHVVSTCESRPGFTALRRACLVRDPAGRVRLVVDPVQKTELDLVGLAEQLAEKLGNYFANPILSTAGAPEERRVAQSILDQSTDWPRTWEIAPDPITGKPNTPGQNWRALQRMHSKHAWLSVHHVDPPWELSSDNPAIVSFYSFKGGVGRTTLLATMARCLAAQGHRVVAIDLDLEAPGLGTFLGTDTERGVLDFVVDYLVTSKPDLAKCSGAATALGDDVGSRVEVIPAGRMNWAFVEKLGRLDFASIGPLDSSESPVGLALRALLHAIRDEMKPNYILIDSRAGLHDLGGLSVHALAHADVLVARATKQNLLGLEIALQTLGQRKKSIALRRLLVAHSLAPRRDDKDIATKEEDDFRQQVYELFGRWIYPAENTEQRDSDDAPHYPWPVFQHPDLERLSTLQTAPVEILEGEDFRRLCDRLVELCEPEEGDDEPDSAVPASELAGGNATP